MLLQLNNMLATLLKNESILETVIVHRQFDEELETVNSDLDSVNQTDLLFKRRPLYDVETLNNIESLEQSVTDYLEQSGTDNLEENVESYICDRYLDSTLFVAGITLITIFFLSIYFFIHRKKLK
jgi:hypothetical protein